MRHAMQGHTPHHHDDHLHHDENGRDARATASMHHHSSSQTSPGMLLGEGFRQPAPHLMDADGPPSPPADRWSTAPPPPHRPLDNVGSRGVVHGAGRRVGVTSAAPPPGPSSCPKTASSGFFPRPHGEEELP